MFTINIDKRNNPSGLKDFEDTTLSEAIESVYDNYTDYKIKISINNDVLVLDFKGDVSSTINDFIKFHQITLLNERQFMISFLSSSFTAIWYISRTDWITINPKWTTANFEKKGKRIDNPNYSDYERPIVIETNSFISQWEKLLIEVREDLKRVGYGRELEGFEYLESLPSINPEV